MHYSLIETNTCMSSALHDSMVLSPTATRMLRQSFMSEGNDSSCLCLVETVFVANQCYQVSVVL